MAVVVNLVFLFKAESLTELTPQSLVTNVSVVLICTTAFGFMVAANGEFRPIPFTGVFKELMKLAAPLAVLIGIYTYVQFRFLATDLIELRLAEIREIWESSGNYSPEEIEKGISNQKQWLSPFIQTTFFFVATIVTGFLTSILVGLLAKKPGI